MTDALSKKAKDTNKKKQMGIAQFVSNADDGFIAWDTAWNLYNAVTRYTSHVQGGFSNKEKSLLCGSGRETNFNALDIVNEVCGVSV